MLYGNALHSHRCTLLKCCKPALPDTFHVARPLGTCAYAMNRTVHRFTFRFATRKPLNVRTSHFLSVQNMSARPLSVLSDAGYLPAAALPGHLHAP